MRKQLRVGGVVAMLAAAAVLGIANCVLAILFVDTVSVKQDEVAVSTYAINLFVGWVFFSAWFLTRADEEWKKVYDSVARKERETFLIEAPKQMPHTLRLLHVIISVLSVLSFHLLHPSSRATLVEINLGVAFFITMTTLVLWDLDDPVHGVINVPGIPPEWCESLEREGRRAK